MLLAILVLFVWHFNPTLGAWDLEAVLLGGQKGKSSSGELELDSAALEKLNRDRDRCVYSVDVSPAIQSILCSVESYEWFIPHDSAAFRNAGCMLGKDRNHPERGSNRCTHPHRVPPEDGVKPSEPPQQSKNAEYSKLAHKAEELIPKTWWRMGFAHESFLFSHNDESTLPTRAFNIRLKVRHKKLRNLNQCANRQQFIRKSYSFLSQGENQIDNHRLDTSHVTTKDSTTSSAAGGTGEDTHGNGHDVMRKARSRRKNPQKCTAMDEPVIQSFLTMWKEEKYMFGGGWVHKSKCTAGVNGSNRGLAVINTEAIKKGNNIDNRDVTQYYWWPRVHEQEGDLLVKAHEVINYFYENYGGIWTGCFAMGSNPDCRGALASAALIVASHILVDIAAIRKDRIDVHSRLTQGYILVSLGRTLLHGDTDTTGNLFTTSWNLRLADFTAMQQAYLKLYVDSYGSLYAAQLEKGIPLHFTPEFQVHAKPAWKEIAIDSTQATIQPSEGVVSSGMSTSKAQVKILHHRDHMLEPVYSNLRNWMYVESNNLIDFGPYRPLVAIPQVNKQLREKGATRVLIDVGANGFYASPKYLIDSYAPYLPFHKAILIEPEAHFSESIPASYSARYNITNLKIYAEVNTQQASDIITMLPTLVGKDDYVVLKFDVDPNKFAYGATMEWGFLFDLMNHPEVSSLIDELYIELHFHYPALYWDHYHSNWEALDAIRYLRRQGMVVHAWP